MLERILHGNFVTGFATEMTLVGVTLNGVIVHASAYILEACVATSPNCAMPIA